MDGGRPNHEDWISGQASAPARGAPSMEESMRRSVAMRVERARIVEKANVEAGKREIGEARKAKRRASRASRDEKPREDPKLEVLLVGCRGLPKMDMLLGKCDAYVVVAVGDETRKSKTVIRSYNPVFNERLVFSVPPLVDRVALTIYDYDMIGSDELVGNVEEPLVTANARANELLRRDICHATARRKHGNGCVKFKLRWLEADGDGDAAAPAPAEPRPNATRRRSFDGAVGGRRGSVGGGRRRSVGGRSLGSLGERPAAPAEASPALPKWRCQRCAYDDNDPAADTCEAALDGHEVGPVLEDHALDVRGRHALHPLPPWHQRPPHAAPTWAVVSDHDVSVNIDNNLRWPNLWPISRSTPSTTPRPPAPQPSGTRVRA